MSEPAHHDVAKHVKIYIGVFLALLVGTLITVLLNSVHFDSMRVTIAIALAVALVKAGLVAGVFMHLASERKVIYLLLAFTVFFFLGLMFLTLFAYGDFPPQTATH
jgi:cytochrome c oxidase subunit IV